MRTIRRVTGAQVKELRKLLKMGASLKQVAVNPQWLMLFEHSGVRQYPEAIDQNFPKDPQWSFLRWIGPVP